MCFVISAIPISPVLLCAELSLYDMYHSSSLSPSISLYRLRFPSLPGGDLGTQTGEELPDGGRKAVHVCLLTHSDQQEGRACIHQIGNSVHTLL